MSLANYSDCTCGFFWQFNLHEECLYLGFVAHFNDLWFTACVDGGIFFFMEMSAIKREEKNTHLAVTQHKVKN